MKEMKTIKTQSNRKHKMFVSRFEPPLYSPPSPPWRVSTILESFTIWSTEDWSTELHRLQWPLLKRYLHKNKKTKLQVSKWS